MKNRDFSQPGRVPVSFSYRDSGVDIEAGNLAVEKIRAAVHSTRRPEVLGEIGGFGGLFALLPGRYQEPVLVSGTDGVGTKLKIVFMMNRHETIGRDLVAMCVNDVLAQGAEPLFFLDYFSCGRLDPEQLTLVVDGIAAGCREAGCALIGGETAEMIGFYPEGEYDLAGFCVGVTERARLLPSPDLVPGDQVLGLASSGLHANGYSLVRKICFDYLKLKVDDYIEELGCPLGEELLTPTRLYPKIILPLLAPFQVKALVHLTGGGFQENLPRVLPEGLAIVIDPSAWVVPPIFHLLQQWGGVTDFEMFRTFNMGIGLAVIVPSSKVEGAVAALQKEGETVFRLGHLERGERRVIISGVTDG
ncbi:MAG: phosphoribosylformylglycinamidine cyclo-ligase [Candidatus Adiutrix intracellularis]|jgi:phosphoribosylformylglycinamidine cyclo-ligase|nr:phosphoribosylformylglycinamidine cyclo-ligase [Candidatus Adiutrix intracellularis]